MKFTSGEANAPGDGSADRGSRQDKRAEETARAHGSGWVLREKQTLGTFAEAARSATGDVFHSRY